VSRVFADTGYWIALLNPRDDLHDRAKNLSQSLQQVHIVTSEMVLTEVLNNRFSRGGENYRRAAVDLVHNLRSNPDTTVIPQTSTWFNRGLTLYRQRLDKAWSLTDCVSFEIMREQQITEALAYDIHFTQAGFIPLLRNQIRRW